MWVELGRIAAQTAKQVIIQKIRDAERELTFNEFKDRKGELITGIVRRFERGNIIVDLNRAEAVLPPSRAGDDRDLPSRRPHPGLRPRHQQGHPHAPGGATHVPIPAC